MTANIPQLRTMHVLVACCLVKAGNPAQHASLILLVAQHSLTLYTSLKLLAHANALAKLHAKRQAAGHRRFMQAA